MTESMNLFPFLDGGLNSPHMSLLNATPTRYLWVLGCCGAGCYLAAAQLEQVIRGGRCRNMGRNLSRRPSLAICRSAADRMWLNST